jgi:RND family efflux transporter MFP subunit
MKSLLAPLGRSAVTIIIVLLAILVAVWLWRRYETDPWTRDGHIRADVVRITPDVGGLITQVAVHDNQRVKAGDVLFVVDRPRFELTLAQNDAAIQSARATLLQARREAQRDLALGDLVAKETHEQNVARVATASAALAQAQSARSTAALNLSRTTVRASVNGTVTNLDLHPGDYIAAGAQAMALVEADPVTVHLMGEPRALKGRVDSIAAGISDNERSVSANQLPTVNPTFTWVRLAQRIPVRVKLVEVPQGVALIVGRSATVTVVPQGPQVHA